MLIEEAKKKICPLNNVVSWEGAKATMCSADQCMAWRWNEPEIKNDGYCGLAGKEGAV